MASPATPGTPLPETRALIDRLIAFDTTSHKSNLELIDFVSDYLNHFGITAERVANEDGTKAGLIATIGPAVPGGVVLSGHTDVVPVAGQAWSSDPFRVRENAGRLYGRGTCDMKSFIAIALALVPEWQRMGLCVPLHLALSYDEEVGCLGAPPLIERLKASLPRPAAVIVGEPSDMQVIHAHKGIAAFTTTAAGKAAHSSAPALGASAIAAAARLIEIIGRMQEDERNAPPPGADVFEPPYVTFNVGRIAGGEAGNIIAERCRLEWECRTMPGRDAATILARFEALAQSEALPLLQKTHPAATIVTEQVANVPPLSPDPGSAAETLTLKLAGHNRCHTAAFTAEAGLFQAAGLPAVICGPGSIAQAHQPDEFVALAQVAACEAMLRALGHWAAS